MSPDVHPPSTLLFALASDLLDHPGLLRRLLDEARAEGREVAEFSFNITDVTVNLRTDSATITDVLYGEGETTSLAIEALLRPFDLAESLPARCLDFVKEIFGGTWRDATVWLSALPDTSQDLERIVTAAVAQSRGDLAELQRAVSLGRLDWRDLLMNGGLGAEDWPKRLDTMLGRSKRSRKRQPPG